MGNFRKIKILSVRKWNSYFPLQVVFEWEDILARSLNINIDVDSTEEMNNIFERQPNFFLQKILRNTFLYKYADISLGYLQKTYPQTLFLKFLLYPTPIKNHYSYQENCIPILLDCFADTIKKVPAYFKKNKLIFVTNIEVYEHLLNSSIGHKITYIPLSISDKYFKDKFPVKALDVLHIGRQNPILHKWMMELVKNHPHIEYVYYTSGNNTNGYVSTTKGWIGEMKTRNDFMTFFSSAKIALLSSPGIDGGEKRTGGYNPVTPRFYEAAVNYCYMIGRFPDAPDFIHNKIAEVCDRAGNYTEFESLILKMLQTPFNRFEKYKSFITEHLTSSIATKIQTELIKL